MNPKEMENTLSQRVLLNLSDHCVAQGQGLDFAEERIASLEAQLHTATNGWAAESAANAELRAELQEAHRDNAQLRQALEQIGGGRNSMVVAGEALAGSA